MEGGFAGDLMGQEEGELRRMVSAQGGWGWGGGGVGGGGGW